MSTPHGSGSLPHLQMILEQLPDATLAMDRDGCIAFWNRAAERFFHLSACTVVGRRPHDVPLSPWLSLADHAAVVSAARRGDVVRHEGVHSNGTGRRVDLEFAISALADADGTFAGTLVVLRDISAGKRRERDLERQIEALQGTSEPLRPAQGLIPICSHCKQIRDAGGAWHAMDAYLSAQCGVRFTHGICPACLTHLRADPDNQPPWPR